MSEPQALRRALSLPGATAISTGLAFAALNFLGMAQLLGYVSGAWSWAAVAAGGLLILVVRALFSELNGMYPTAAGIRMWMSRAMNDRLALIITLTYMTAIVLVIAADAFIIGEAIAYAFSNGQVVAIGYVAVLLTVATALNLRGIKLAGRAELVVTSVVVAATVVVGVIAIVRHGSVPAGPVGAAPVGAGPVGAGPVGAGPVGAGAPGRAGGGSPVQALILGIFLYTGFEWVTTNAEEVVRPKIIPRAMLAAVLVLAVSQGLFAVAMGLTVGSAGRQTAYPQLLAAQHALGHAGLLVMLGVTALTAVNTFNGGFVTMSRFMYAVAREGKLPRALTRLNDRAVPVLPVWLLGGSSLVLAVVVAVTGSWVMVVSVCAALEMMIYAAAGFVVFRLRRKQPAAERPFRLAGGRGCALAATVVFGLLGLVSAVTVGARTSVVPLLFLLVVAGLVTVYVCTVLPRLERREAAELAARRAARAATRAATTSPQPQPQPSPSPSPEPPDQP